MAYDNTKTQQLLEILQTRSLTKSERAIAREQIDLFYAQKLAGLQKKLFDTVEKMRSAGEPDPFEVDDYIHHYHKQSQELYAYMNHRSLSNENLRIWLALIDEDEQGLRVWEPKTQLPDEEKRNQSS
jgi:hypothetical protein